MKLELRTVRLHPTVVRTIKRHCEEQAAKGNYEAVGFVAAKFGSQMATATMPLHNHAPDPKHHFFVEPWEHYRALNKLEQQGYDVLGVYHSHVNSEALPSGSDHALAWAEGYVFIYSVVFEDLKAYKKVDEILVPVELIEEEA